MRVLQVTDCHLAADPGADYRGQSAERNLHRLSAAVEAFEPDRLVLTGDLSEDASPASYERIVDWASGFGCPVAWLPGNHDDRSRMQDPFDAAGWDAGPVIEAGDWQLVLLDSAWVDEPAGRLTPERLEPLKRLDGMRPVGIFVHHQPVPVGAAWIDKVPLVEPDAFWNATEAAGGVRFVAFGHVHQRFRGRHRGIACLAAPSAAANSLAGMPRFTPGEAAPMARWFVLEDGGRWSSGLIGV
ncbi:metallophosphoesterase [Halomonas denitrificans]|nr:metallophosphoesterase [Halomonas denitrificans]